MPSAGGVHVIIKEGKLALRWTRLSCHAFRHNAVRLQLHALAYNLANFLRSLALPDAVEQWSLTTLREKLVKIGATDRAPRPLCRLPAGRGGGAEDAVRRDPAPDRRSAATVAAAPGMSIASNDRWQPDGRGASMIDRERPKAAQKAGASLVRRVDAADGAGSTLRRLAENGRNGRSSALGAGHPGNPGLFWLGIARSKF